jgi:hypothetical protein
VVRNGTLELLFSAGAAYENQEAQVNSSFSFSQSLTLYLNENLSRMVISLVVVSTMAVQEKIECRIACSIVSCSFLHLVMDMLTKVGILDVTGSAPPVPPMTLVLCIVSFLIVQPSRGMQERFE